MSIVLLAGGTGAAKLARGLDAVLPAGELTVITNTADDDEFWGLHVSPDTDSVIYRLAGVFNEDAGFGVADETFHALEMLGRLGEPTWFGLGDRDIGLHLLRARLLGDGLRLTEATSVIAQRLALHTRVVPMSDDPVRTRIITDSGEVSLQEWFVRDRCAPPLRSLRCDGIAEARPSPEAAAAVAAADAVIIGPSNPLISIDPILELVRDRLRRERVMAIAPVIAGASLKGPTVDMLRAAGEEATALGVARRYAGVAAAYVLDAQDAELAAAVGALGMRAHVRDTVMDSEGAERRFARELVTMAASLR